MFCASLADVFEARAELDPWRADLWKLIEECDELDWLLLTKRPENVRGMVPASWLGKSHLPVHSVGTCRDCGYYGPGPGHDCPRGWPRHVWIGTTVENQVMADERIPHLLGIPAAVRFLSVEPLLGPVHIEPFLRWSGTPWRCSYCKRYAAHFGDAYGRGDCPSCKGAGGLSGSHELNGKGRVSWVIVGGESGPKARPLHPDWARSLRDQCVAAGVSFHFKQWGEWAPDVPLGARSMLWFDASGSCLDPMATNFPPDTDVMIQRGASLMCCVGKKTAGRILDGRTWDEVPRGS